MKALCRALLALALATAAAPGALAQEAKAAAPKISGRSFIRLYTRYLDDDREGKRIVPNNEFGIDRAYLNFEFSPFKNGRFFYQLEGGAMRDTGTGTAGNYFDVATKALFLEVKDIGLGTFLRIGQVELPWVGWVDGNWGYRVLGENFVNRAGYLDPVDLGLSLGGNLGGFLAWQVNSAAGEGWKSAEQGWHQDFHGRLTLFPLSPLGVDEVFLSGAGTVGNYDEKGKEFKIEGNPRFNKARYIGEVGINSKGNLLMAADYLFLAQDPAEKLSARYKSLADLAKQNKLSNATGLSVYGVLNCGLFGTIDALEPLELLGRYDMLDPDNTVLNNGMTRQVGGLAWHWNKNVASVIAYEQEIYELEYEAKGATTARTPAQKVVLTTDIKF